MLRAGKEDVEDGVSPGNLGSEGGDATAVPLASGARNAETSSGSGYYICHRGRQYGPASLGEIKAWRLDARIDDSTYIWSAEGLAWIPLIDFAPWKELALGASERRSARALEPAEGTILHPRGYARLAERRHAFRLFKSLVMEFCVLERNSNRPATLMGSIKIDNISAHGVGFTVYRTSVVPGNHLFMKIHLEESEAIESVGEVVRVEQRQHVGVGFRKIKGKANLDEFLKRRR